MPCALCGLSSYQMYRKIKYDSIPLRLNVGKTKLEKTKIKNLNHENIKRLTSSSKN